MNFEIKIDIELILVIAKINYHHLSALIAHYKNKINLIVFCFII